VDRYKFRVFADNGLFFLHDGDYDPDIDVEEFGKQVTKTRLAIFPGVIAILAASQMSVPVDMQVLTKPPKEYFSKWDAVVESGIVVPSGVLFLVGSGSTDEFGERMEVAPGCYGVRVYYGGQSALEDLEGNDYYKIVLWPLFQYSVRVLKRWRPSR